MRTHLDKSILATIFLFCFVVNLNEAILILITDTGHCGMEIVIVLLLLSVTLTAATPLRPTHRSVEEHQEEGR